MRAVAYIRVSTEEQAHEGVSLAAQRTKVEAYCQLRGLELAEVVVDAGVSAGKTLQSRPGGARVLELVEKRVVGAVVALKLDRLFRNATDCLQVADRWQRRGVALHLVDLGGQAVDTGSAAGRFFFLMLAGVAEMERGQIRERTKLAMQHKKAIGLRVGQVPYGFRCSEVRKLVCDDAEQGAIKRVFELRQEGASLRTIVATLQREGHPARGARWHLTTVSRLLSRHHSS